MNSDAEKMTNGEAETPTPSALPEEANQMEPAFGWTPYAETINGRFAMIGFMALLIIELVTRQDFFTWLGLR
ncbi:MAG: chlorophyll a/b-binding protein [Elainellaceae cyanobacterium]